jgi:hypothetical protein
MLGNRYLVCDTFCEVYDLLKPWVDLDFFDFSKHEVQSNAIYLLGRAQFNHNLEKVQALLDNDQIQLILSNPAEGSETLKLHVQRSGFEQHAQSGKLLLIGGGDMEPDYQYLQYDSFLPKLFDYEENIAASKFIDDIFNKTTKPFKFLFLNGRARPNRKYLLHYFKRNGLLQQAIWTNLDTYAGQSALIKLVIDGHDVMSDPCEIQLLPARYEVDRYKNNLEDCLRQGWVKRELFEYSGNWEWGDIYLTAAPYVDTYFSVVTETIFEYPYSFRTEKIWKPIAMGHPFVAVANCGFYRDLHQLGFKTFDPIIDESFDNIDDNTLRLERIRDVIIQLCASDLVKFHTQVKQICQYNQQHLWTMRQQVRDHFPNRFRQFLLTQGVIHE